MVQEINDFFKMQGLKGMTWNSEGFRDPNKYLFVHETVRKQKVRFSCLVGTGRSNFIVPKTPCIVVGCMVLLTTSWTLRGYFI